MCQSPKTHLNRLLPLTYNSICHRQPPHIFEQNFPLSPAVSKFVQVPCYKKTRKIGETKVCIPPLSVKARGFIEARDSVEARDFVEAESVKKLQNTQGRSRIKY